MKDVFRSTRGIRRGCGTRVPGGVYLECGQSPYGVPLEHYILDTPRPFKTDSAIGVQMWEHPKTGVWHIVDYVGRSHYPYASDVIEEGRNFGFSRRVPPNLRFEYLTPDSRLILVHDRGRVKNPEDFANAFTVPGVHERYCAKWQKAVRRIENMENESDHIHIDKPGEFACNALWYVTAKPNRANVFVDGTMRHIDFKAKEGEAPWAVRSAVIGRYGAKGGAKFGMVRRIGDTEYAVFPPRELERTTEDWVYPEFEQAAIAILPLTNITVVRHQSREITNDTFSRVRGKVGMFLNVETSND